MKYDMAEYTLGNSCRLDVAASTIHNRGLFATCPIQRNELVTFYDGEYIDWHTAQTRTDRSYMRSVAFGYSVIDGLRVPLPNRGAGSFTNHSSKPNAKFWTRENTVWIKAKTEINVGQEICVNYGKTYWKLHPNSVIT